MKEFQPSSGHGRFKTGRNFYNLDILSPFQYFRHLSLTRNVNCFSILDRGFLRHMTLGSAHDCGIDPCPSATSVQTTPLPSVKDYEFRWRFTCYESIAADGQVNVRLLLTLVYRTKRTITPQPTTQSCFEQTLTIPNKYDFRCRVSVWNTSEPYDVKLRQLTIIALFDGCTVAQPGGVKGVRSHPRLLS